MITSIVSRIAGAESEAFAAERIVDALPHPVLAVDAEGKILFSNHAAEAFFQLSEALLLRTRLKTLVPFGSPILQLIEQARSRRAAVNEYRIDIGTPSLGMERIVDVHVAPITDNSGDDVVVVTFQERTVTDKIERQLTHRTAARSVTGLAAMLAHEIKNPLFGIKGASQLLESTVGDDDRMLTRLIGSEADRIVRLVDRVEVFADNRPVEREPVNVHEVLEHVRELSSASFAKHVTFIEDYDPSLPPVLGSRDQLIQVFLNLIKNAAEAVKGMGTDAEIVLKSAFQPGIRISVPGAGKAIGLPLAFTVQDNGPGVPAEIQENLFDPFVTTKESGSGLGLALVAKVIGDHGGVVECESEPRRTQFRVLLPMHRA